MKLICIDGPLQGREFSVNKDIFSIGGKNDNDLFIPGDEFVSRHHAYIQNMDGTKYYLFDKQSRNGTKLNNQSLQDKPVMLSNGDQIKIGGSTFKIADLVIQKQHLENLNHIKSNNEIPDNVPMAYQGTAIPSAFQELPKLEKGQRLDLEAIRDPYEFVYLVFVWLPTVAIALGIIYLVFDEHLRLFLLYALGYGALIFLSVWIIWKLFSAKLLGHCIKVGPKQYPQIYSLINDAGNILDIKVPDIFIMQGHGLFEVLVSRFFLNRGFLIITSNLLDDFTENGSSRELMFFVGRQLGLIANGFFDYWFFKHFLGQFTFFFYWAWQRRCHLTADQVGLLVAGDLYASEQALCVITAGSGVAANTNIAAIEQQRMEVRQNFWCWLNLGFSSYPYMVERIYRLRQFANEATARGLQTNVPIAIAALPIKHRSIRALPIMIIHGHDSGAKLELENFLLKQFPHVALITMINEVDGAYSLPEKFEKLAGRVKGALALLTPDDIALTLRDRSQNPRARQNVIGEIFWMWARLGRDCVLLLSRGEVEIPSDLSGVDLHRFTRTPIECSEQLREFIAYLENR